MATIESTPEMAANVYDTMERNLEVVRRRLGRDLTLADKVLLGHLDDPEHQDMESSPSATVNEVGGEAGICFNRVPL